MTFRRNYPLQSKQWKGRRKPVTSKLDAIKKFFTTEENEVNALLDQVKEIRNNWNKEKVRRQQLAEQQQQDQERGKMKRICRD
jgi:hypothetical protein